jgi:putative addiction module component (TIGR02574 family)
MEETYHRPKAKEACVMLSMNTHLLDQARELSIDERLQLVEAIWDSIAESAALPLTEAQKAELDRRLADHEANPSDVVSWNEVKASVLAHIGR